MRKQNFSVDPSTPGARPMLAPTSREGQLFYAAPQEVDDLVKAGNHALPTDAEKKIIEDDLAKGRANQGTVSKMLGFTPAAQSPEAKEIRDRLQNWEAMQLANSPLMKSQIQDKAIGGAVVASAPAAAFTAGALAPTATGVLTTGGEEIVGPSLARQGLQWLGSQVPNAPGWLKGVGAGVGLEEGGRWLYNKLTH
jgi:hypothetical protein